MHRVPVARVRSLHRTTSIPATRSQPTKWVRRKYASSTTRDFVVGPNSRAVIDDFLFKPDGTATDVALNAVKGTFRFITGKSPKEVYSIKTPTMSIVVRGTIVDLHVLGSGESIASWQEGSGQACVAPAGQAGGGRTECRDVNAGDVVGSEPGGGFKTFKPGERRSDLAVINQGLGPGLAPEFRTRRHPWRSLPRQNAGIVGKLQARAPVSTTGVRGRRLVTGRQFPALPGSQAFFFGSGKAPNTRVRRYMVVA